MSSRELRALFCMSRPFSSLQTSPKRQLSSPLKPPPLLSHSLDAARRSFARLLRGRQGGTSARSSIHDHSRMGAQSDIPTSAAFVFCRFRLQRPTAREMAHCAPCVVKDDRDGLPGAVSVWSVTLSPRVRRQPPACPSLSLSPPCRYPVGSSPPPSSCPSVHQPSPAFKTSFASSRPSSRPLITRSSSERVSSTSPGRSRGPSSTRGTRRW